MTAAADLVRTHEGFTEQQQQQQQRGLGERSYLGGASVEPLITCLAAQFGVSSSYSSNNNNENNTISSGGRRISDANDDNDDVLLQKLQKSKKNRGWKS